MPRIVDDIHAIVRAPGVPRKSETTTFHFLLIDGHGAMGPKAWSLARGRARTRLRVTGHYHPIIADAAGIDAISVSRRDRSPINRLSSRTSRGSPRQRRLVIAPVDALLLDQPAAVELHAEIVIEAHGVERPGVGRGKPLHHLPIGAHRNPVRCALERYVLHPVLTAAPSWLGEGLDCPTPHRNRSSGRLHGAIRGE